ncbi:MAG: c-type cytochrome [Thermodesulfobacteriota bacterium]
MKKIFITIFLLMLVPVYAGAAGNADNGRKVYDKRCWWCHGEDGAGEGPAAEYLVPPPRDFTSVMFKFKTTPFDEVMPSDDDLFGMVKGKGDDKGGTVHNSIRNWRGMNDSSMPGWDDMLSDEEIWDVIAYIKGLAELEPPELGQLDFSSQVASSEDSIAKGKEIFKDNCTECHGQLGKGDGTKKLKDDAGYRTWPRNFTKAWSFRVNNDPRNIYARASIGIPGTQMPSFADPESKKKLSDEERWHVANYVASLDEPYKKPGNNTVIKAVRVEGDVPETSDNEAWAGAAFTSFYMVPQIIAEERLFTPSINSVSVKAVYNDNDIALLIEWDDRTKSLPGDEKAKEIADGDPLKDAFAVQLPVTLAPAGETEKPYFGMGSASKPVNIWHWIGESTTDPQALHLLEGKGFKDFAPRDAEPSGLKAQGVYDNGTWRVVMKRKLKTGVEQDLQFEEGKFIPISFAAWDGSNFDEGSKHVMTAWYWLLMEPKTGSGVVVWPLAIALLVFGGELLWLRSARKR